MDIQYYLTLIYSILRLKLFIQMQLFILKQGFLLIVFYCNENQDTTCPMYCVYKKALRTLYHKTSLTRGFLLDTIYGAGSIHWAVGVWSFFLLYIALSLLVKSGKITCRETDKEEKVYDRQSWRSLSEIEKTLCI